MATKSKNKWTFIIWLFLFVTGISWTLSGLSMGQHYLRGSYFESDSFKDGYLNPFLRELFVNELNYLTPEEAKKQIYVTDGEIEEHRYRYGNLETQLSDIKVQYEDRINNTTDETIKKALITERDSKIEDISKNFSDDEHVRAKIVKEKEKQIDELYGLNGQFNSSALQSYKQSLNYYFKNKTTGDVFTNLKNTEQQDLAKLEKDALYYEENPVFSNYDYYYSGTNLTSLINGNFEPNFEGVILVPKGLSANSNLMKEVKIYEKEQRNWAIQLAIGILLFIGTVLYYRRSPMKNEFFVSEEKIPGYKRLPFDVKLALFGLSAFILFYAFSINSNYYYGNMYSLINRILSFETFILIASTVLTLLQGQWLYVYWKNEELRKEVWKDAFILKLWNLIKDVFANRKVGTQISILLIITFLAGLGLISGFAPHLLLLYIPFVTFVFIPTLYLFFKYTSYFNRILEASTNVAAGHYEKDIPVKGRSVFAKLAHNINSMKNNVNQSQQQQAKSERLKTELISNVSHDLRTPLTSIITYTDLLKQENLSEDERNAYLEIIDRKSKRLKVLIDDLFEASKMATGNMELTKEKVDIAQLLKQALAELDDKIQDSTLTFRPVIKEEPLYAVVDGRKLWRVFDNLITNILKYSLEHSRVYITLEKKENEAVITFKNISKYELGIDTDELFERFKRGDTSRHTDGSGLGLAIAKSIIDMHDGQMDIELDGDLFSVVVRLPV